MGVPPLVGWASLMFGWFPGVSQTRPPGYFLSTLRVEWVLAGRFDVETDFGFGGQPRRFEQRAEFLVDIAKCAVVK